MEEIRENGSGIIYADESYLIMGVCFAVYKEMGCGFLEAVYQECIQIELVSRGISFVAQQRMLLEYMDSPLQQVYLADFVCYERIIIEIKAVADIAPEHRAQTMNYLKATGLDLGLLVNFGSHPKLQYEPIACTLGRYGKSETAT